MSEVQLAQRLAGKHILLIVGGGVAAYKSLELVRRLRERGAGVRVVMTAAAKEFVTPLSFVSLSGAPVYDDLFSPTDEQEMGHIQLSRAADLIVVAPATAHLIARAAQGLCDDLATTLLLATNKRALYAPSMNVRMWAHPATQRNLARIHGDGGWFVGPNNGEMACGEYGPGRMAEPSEIIAAVETALAQGAVLPSVDALLRVPTGATLAGRHVVVTSGPTHEAIDPVRFIANRSSGKQGHAVAQAAARAGARVTLISGPVTVSDPPGCRTIHVESAQEMLTAVMAALPADAFIGVAAVADWRVASAPHKIKKNVDAGAPALTLVENPDILATVARGPSRPQIVVGFAAETENIVDHARAKLVRKGCDMIVANDVGEGSDVFGGDSNTAHLVTRDAINDLPHMSKSALADRIIAFVAASLSPVQEETA